MDVKELFRNEPWKLSNAPADFLTELKDVCDEIPETSVKKIVYSVDPRMLPEIFPGIIFQLLMHDGDPRDFMKDFSQVVVCRWLNEGFDEYYMRATLDNGWEILRDLDGFRRALEAYKRIDWDEVGHFVKKIRPEDTYEARWIQYYNSHGKKAFEKKIKEMYSEFDKDFLHDLAAIVKYLVLTGYYTELGEHFEEFEHLHRYNPDAFNVDAFIEKIEKNLWPHCSHQRLVMPRKVEESPSKVIKRIIVKYKNVLAVEDVEALLDLLEKLGRK